MMAIAKTRRPCRKCGGQKIGESRHSWYCANCAESVWREFCKRKNVCGGDHDWGGACLTCERIRRARLVEAAQRGAETRRRNNPAYARPTQAELLIWQGIAHRAVFRAVKGGLLPSLKSRQYACVDCGGVAIEYDHRDYSRPLEVDPVCHVCNIARGAAKYPAKQDFPRLKEKKAA